MTLSQLGGLVRRHDPDRFLCALFAPQAQRETLFALYAFNHELARAREAVREPMLALIRLQWWREVVGGARRRHEVAGPLGAALDGGLLEAGDLLGMIDGREMEAAPSIATLAEWGEYLRATAGGVMAAAGRVLGADAALRGRLRVLGAGYGAAGVRRSVAVLARQGRCLLPGDLLLARGLTPEGVIAEPGLAAPVLAELAGVARGWLREAGGAMPRAVLAAALPAVLGRRDLRRAGAGAGGTGDRGTGDRLAVAWAVGMGRV